MVSFFEQGWAYRRPKTLTLRQRSRLPSLVSAALLRGCAPAGCRVNGHNIYIVTSSLRDDIILLIVEQLTAKAGRPIPALSEALL